MLEIVYSLLGLVCVLLAIGAVVVLPTIALVQFTTQGACMNWSGRSNICGGTRRLP